MADFKKQGGSLTGREERYDGFEGEPRAVGGALGGSTSTTGTGTGTGTGIGSGTRGTGYDNNSYDNYDNSTGTTGKKPGLLDRLNPKKDTDGDGKAGIGD